MPSNITIRYADTRTEEAMREDSRTIFRLAIQNYEETGFPEGLAPFDPVKCLQSIYETVRDGFVLLAFDGDRLVGGLGCSQWDIWYSQATMLAERFFFILPEYRDGDALKGLLEEAKAVADDLGIAISLTIANTQKRNRPPRNGLQRVASQLTYFPQGNQYLIQPAGEDAR